MSTAPSPPADLLRRLVASDPGRPRVTVYDDTDSPTRGERIELSARVLANWVAKAANLLQDDLDVGPGSTLCLDLPPHWRTLYWALAAWSVGACVEVPARRTGDAATGADADAAPPAPGRADVVVTDDHDVADDADEAVLVTLAALARAAAGSVPAGVVDEARELATHGDLFAPMQEPDAGDVALRVAGGSDSGGEDTTYGDLLPGDAGGVGMPARVHTSTGDTATFLRLALEVWTGDGSLVLSRGEPAADVLSARMDAEGVTRRE